MSYNFLQGALSYLLVWFFLFSIRPKSIEKSKLRLVLLFLSLLSIKYFSLTINDAMLPAILQKHVLRDFTFLMFAVSVAGILGSVRLDLILKCLVYFLVLPSSLLSLGQLVGINFDFLPSNNIEGSMDFNEGDFSGYGFPGLFFSVNIAAYFYTVGATMCFALPFSLIRRIIGIIILLSLVSLGNRSGPVAFVVAMMCYLILQRKLWTLLLVTIVATLVLQTFDTSALRLASMTNSRDGIGPLVIETLLKNPFVGNPKYFASLMEISGYEFLSPHNFIFYVVVNTGFIGLLILVVYMFLQVININWRLSENHFALAIFLSYYLNAMAHNFSPLHGDWFGFLVCLGFTKIYRNEASIVHIA